MQRETKDALVAVGVVSATVGGLWLLLRKPPPKFGPPKRGGPKDGVVVIDPETGEVIPIIPGGKPHR